MSALIERIKSRYLTIWIILTVALAVIGAVHLHYSAPDEATRAYRDISAKQKRVFKWTHDLRIEVLTQGQIELKYASSVFSAIETAGPVLPIKLNRSTGQTDIRIIFVHDVEKAIREFDRSIRLATVDDEGYRVLVEQMRKVGEMNDPSGGCVNARAFDDKAEPGFFLLLVFPNGAVASDAFWRSCLARHLFGDLGLGSGETTAQSIFNPDLALQMPTDLDVAMLRRFYEAEIASGMSRDEARRLFSSAPQ